MCFWSVKSNVLLNNRLTCNKQKRSKEEQISCKELEKQKFLTEASQILLLQHFFHV